eukprot:COSAG01_NODE_206_length_22034_cov_125.512585_20_plen_55_part_00
MLCLMPLCRFLLADRLAPEALRPVASQLLFGDPLSILWCAAAAAARGGRADRKM